MLHRFLFLAACGLATTGLAAQQDKKAPKLPLGTGIRGAAFSPDGALLAAALGAPKTRGRLIVWDVATRKPLWTHEQEPGVPDVTFSPDSKTLAIGGYDHTATLLEAGTGRVLKVLRGHKNFVRAVAFSPDGKTLATGGWDQTVKLWDLDTGNLRRTLEWPSDRLFALAFSPNGQWLLASGAALRVWEAAGGKEHRALGDGRDVYIEWAVFADDHCFLTGDNHGTVRAWSVADGEQRVRFHGMAGVTRIAFSAKAQTVAVATYFDYPIRLYDFTLRGPSAKEKDRLADLLIKLDDDDYAVREAAGKDILGLGFVVEPELRRLAKDGSSAEVRIRCRRLRDELLSKPRATLSGHTEQIEALAFSPDGRLLVSGGRDNTLRLWDLKDNKEIARLLPATP